MSIESQIKHVPRIFNADRASDVHHLYAGADPLVLDLLKGVASTSPFLKSLMEKEHAWVLSNLDRLEQAVAGEIEIVSQVALAQLPSTLRAAKRRVALATALADLGGVWTLNQVTTALTQLADASVHAALVALTRQSYERGKLPMFGETDIADAAGITALAMGKMGAFELNYSSDIDLICLFDETRMDPDDYQYARPEFIKIVRNMAKMLNDRTEDGYVFRTDLRLRPDASVTPVCLSMEAAERYYESVGRTWERAAYIKARACAGDIKAGEGFLKTLSPFVWRKHLDFAAIQDAHDMRLKIREHKGLHGPITLAGHNMKLGRGGIREIEFFTQTRQLIAGGRDVALRDRTTVGGLAALTNGGWVESDVAETLVDHYTAHRTVEHRLQMVQDAQTHDLPTQDDGFARLAAMMDMDVADLKTDLDRRLSEVHQLTEGFFAPSQTETAPVPQYGEDILARWPTYPCMRSERARQVFDRITPAILDRVSKAARPEAALVGFDTFLAGLPAGAQLFALFETNPQLIDLLLDISATTPELSQYLSQNAGVLDAVIAGRFFDPWPDLSDMCDLATAATTAAPDYETKLDALRRWMKEWHFRIGVHHLRGLISPDTASEQYATLAEAVVTAIWPVVRDEFARKHGVAPGLGAAVVGMGSLGAGRLSSSSDLDLIIFYDAQGIETSDGPRPLATRVYYARLTQALITALSAPMSQGRLYEVDMRLRPSGRQGPVAISFDGFKTYQRDEAWTWEHLALTRGRALAGHAQLAQDFETFRQVLIAEKSTGKYILQDVQDMRDRIQAAKQDANPLATKIGAGRLQDIELFAQTVALSVGASVRSTAGQLAAGVTSNLITQAEAEALTDSYDLLWRTQVTSRLLAKDGYDPDTAGKDAEVVILRDSDAETIDALADRLSDHASQADAIISANLQY